MPAYLHPSTGVPADVGTPLSQLSAGIRLGVITHMDVLPVIGVELKTLISEVAGLPQPLL